MKFSFLILSFFVISNCFGQYHDWTNYNSKLKNFPTNIHQLSNPVIRTLQFDGDTAWMGTYRDGLVRFWEGETENFVVYNDSNSDLRGYEVLHTHLLQDTLIWLTDYNSFTQKFTGIFFFFIKPFPNDMFKFTTLVVDTYSIPFPNISDITHYEKTVYMASQQGIVTVLGIDGFGIINTVNSTIPQNEISLVNFNTTGQLFAANGSKLFTRTNDIWSTIDLSKAPYRLKNCTIKKIKNGPNDTTWVITNQGILKIKDSVNIFWANDKIKAEPNEVKDLTFDNNGYPWLIFEHNGGLEYLAMNDQSILEWRQVSSINSNIPDELSVIEVDTRGRIWVGTDNDGIFIYKSYTKGSYVNNTGTIQSRVYPNPANDILHITIEHGATPMDYELIGLNGIVYQYGKINSTSISISTNQYPKGLYILKLIGHNGINSQVISIQ